MCHMVYLSTTCEEDLRALVSDCVRFEPITDRDDPAILALLEYPRRWFLTREFGGCSCHFRHSMAIDSRTGDRIVEFEPPQDWLPEDEDDVAATVAAYDVFSRIVEEGHYLDVVDVWNGARPETIETVGVSLSGVPGDHFRFHEDRRLLLGR